MQLILFLSYFCDKFISFLYSGHEISVADLDLLMLLILLSCKEFIPYKQTLPFIEF
jgi:hypothetical protein